MLDVIAELIKLNLRQGSQLNMMALHLADQACLIEPTLAKCESCKKHPLTLEHNKVKVRLCDRCCSETIVKAQRAFLLIVKHDPQDPFLAIAASLMDENAWVDVDDVDRIRRVVEYAALNKEIDVRQDQVH